MCQQGKRYKIIARTLNVPKGTVGSIVRKFKATHLVATQPGRGKKQKISATATRFLRRKVDKNPRVTAKELQEDLLRAGTEVFIDTVRRTLHDTRLRARAPRRILLLN